MCRIFKNNKKNDLFEFDQINIILYRAYYVRKIRRLERKL